MTAVGADAPAPYPVELERDLALPDGARLLLRPIRPDDEPRLVDLYFLTDRRR
jgi:acetyltransferase